MRNGMSIREVYERLDRYDRLEAAFNKIFDRHFTMRSNLNDVMAYLLLTANQYDNLTKDPVATKEDILEFRGKASGLKEALQVIDDILREDLETANKPKEETDGN